ncbi:MAG: hypothetical protein U9Q61_09195 [Thermodesulfobacteriota bacterium]|nr:hypothetical protein [Thermodesulfobacteriota bacterium]
MQSIDFQLQKFSGVPVSHGTLLNILKDYKTPNNKISRWLAEGILLPLKKGLYLVVPEGSSSNCPLPLIANTLYGPSYVSLEYALYQHGLIPEQAIEVTSVCTKRAKLFENPLGTFSYTRIPTPLFSIGVESIQATDKASYLLASPTKALCDKLLLLRNLRIYSAQSFREFLLNDLRIDEVELPNLDPQIISACTVTNQKLPLLNYLYDWIKELK